MAQHRNRHVILSERATGLPTPELFTVAEDDAPVPGDGEVLLNNIYVTADPGMKGWISKARNYASVETGTTMHSFSVGVVVESNHPDVAEGDVVAANTGWAEYAVADPERPTFRKVDPAAAPLSTALGILGINGFTAYFGLLAVGQPKPGDTVLVSTAAGAVGSAVGQIAKIKGCRTVGIAGGAEKTALCTDVFGFDAAIDYKATDDLEAAIRDACPDGIDVYYDNVGGETLDIVLGQVNLHGRVVICGTAATDAWIPQPSGLRPERNLLVNRIRMEGFLTFDFADRYDEAHKDLSEWVRDGRIQYREDIVDGLENAPAALAGLYEGRNMGRQLIRVRPDPYL
jgi:NADPH-dependent curcumin reductase CurA